MIKKTSLSWIGIHTFAEDTPLHPCSPQDSNAINKVRERKMKDFVINNQSAVALFSETELLKSSLSTYIQPFSLSHV